MEFQQFLSSSIVVLLLLLSVAVPTSIIAFSSSQSILRPIRTQSTTDPPIPTPQQLHPRAFQIDATTTIVSDEEEDTKNQDVSPPNQWEELNGGSRLLLPPQTTTTTTTTTTPRAIVYFLGGVFVSPEPTIAYRYVLEQLVARGYGVVATPFAVDFDYRKPVADIAQKHTAAYEELIERGYGRVPIVGMGHSLGSLMHVLLACEEQQHQNEEGLVPPPFPPLTALALISYNNKNVNDAIPAFQQFFVPALRPLEPFVPNQQQMSDMLSGVRTARSQAFDVIQTAATGVRDRIFGELTEKTNESFLFPGGVLSSTLFLKALDDLEGAAGLVDQVPTVIASVAKGVSEFEPSPSEIRSIIASSFPTTTATTRRCYSQQPPLVIKFTNDSIDESDLLMEALPPDTNAELVELDGTHVTPLAIDPNAASTPLVPVPEEVWIDRGLRGVLLDKADGLVKVLDDYFSRAVEDYGRNGKGES